jgi:hypothetical protein
MQCRRAGLRLDRRFAAATPDHAHAYATTLTSRPGTTITFLMGRPSVNLATTSLPWASASMAALSALAGTVM